TTRRERRAVPVRNQERSLQFVAEIIPAIHHAAIGLARMICVMQRRDVMRAERISLTMFFDGLSRSHNQGRAEIAEADSVIVIEPRGRLRCCFLTGFGQPRPHSWGKALTGAHMLLDQNPIPFL